MRLVVRCVVGADFINANVTFVVVAPLWIVSVVVASLVMMMVSHVARDIGMSLTI